MCDVIIGTRLVREVIGGKQYFSKMETTNNTEPETNNSYIKQEFEPSADDFNAQVKHETEDDTDNPFANLQIEIKQETPLEKDADQQTTDPQTNISETNNEIDIKTEITNPNGNEISIINVKNETAESILPNDDEVDLRERDGEVDLRLSDGEVSVKEEIENAADYNYPSFDDSMDSSEAAALSQVEACLSDDVLIKTEDDDIGKDYIKEESEMNVTETHLISKKLINTTSTVTSTLNGVIESNTTNTVVMEIHPVTGEEGYKVGNPEEILPTSENNFKMDFGDSFLLNSITGNVLSLEQEAYGLLKSKKKVPFEVYTQKCPKCAKWFRTKYDVKKHLRVHESIEKRAMGIIKGLKTKRENHMKKKEKPEDREPEQKTVRDENGDGYKCTCGKIFQRRIRMETCLRSHTEYSDTCHTWQYACPTCQKKFKTKESLTFHRNKFHRKKFPCKFCPTDYHTQKELFRHLQVHQKVQLTEYKVIAEVAKGKQELNCLICSKSCKTLTDLKSHIMDDHKNPYKCQYCEQDVFNKIMDFVDHMKKDHPDVGSQSVLDVVEAFSKLVKAWKCEECGQQFHEADKLALHQVEKHAPEMKNEQHFQCEDCQRVFITNQGLNSHRRMHHRVEPPEPTEPEEIGVMCLACRKMCKDMTALTSHMRLHSMDRKFPCKYCDFRFATPQKRKAHAEIHTGDMKYVCFICEYQCSSENRFKAHKASIKHLNMKEYLLTGKPLIEESTSKDDKIKDTLRKKEWNLKKRSRERKRDRKEEKEGTIACDICGETFNGESDMQEHKQTHPFIEFPNDDKPSRIFFK